MNQKIKPLPLGEIFDETRRFCAQESALLVPVGLATFGPAAIITDLVFAPRLMTMGMAADGLALGSWMLWLVPFTLLTLTGYLALCRLALRPGLSVAEGVVEGIRLLPRALALVLAGMALAMAIVQVLHGAAVLGLPRIAAAGMVVLLIAMLWLIVRLTLLWPAVAADVGGAGATLRHALALSRGRFPVLAMLFIASTLLVILLGGVLQITVGSIILLVAKLVGAGASGQHLVMVLMAGFNAICMIIWAVFIARIHARLTSLS